MWPAGAVLQGISKHHILAPIAIGSGIVKLIVTILLVRPYGLSGVALGTLLPNGIETLVFVLPYTLRILGINFNTVFKEVIFPVLLPSILLVISQLLLREALQPVSFFSIGLVGCLGLLAYLSLYLALGINLPERKIIIELVFNAFQAGRARMRS